jgi:hypothetical protein
MPQAVYHAATNPAPRAVAVYCSDPRFHAAFEQFIENELGLPKGEYIPLVVAGGAHACSNPLRLPKEFKFMKDRLQLYKDRFASINRIILIGHEDCKYFDSVKNRILGFMGVGVTDMIEHHKTSLSLLPETVARVIPGVKIESYYAKFCDPAHSQIIFDPVAGNGSKATYS